MIEWNKMNKFCKWSYEDTRGLQRCEKRSSNPCIYTHCPLRKDIPLKITEKLFKIKYIQPQAYDPDWLNPMSLKGMLDKYTTNECNITTTEFDPRVWEITKIPKDYVVKEPCSKCGKEYSKFHHVDGKRLCEVCYCLSIDIEKDGKDDDMQATGDYPDMYDLAAKMLKKSEKPEIVKSCDNCGWVVNIKDGKQNCKNWKPCYNQESWKPIEKEEKTENEKNANNI